MTGDEIELLLKDLYVRLAAVSGVHNFLCSIQFKTTVAYVSIQISTDFDFCCICQSELTISWVYRLSVLDLWQKINGNLSSTASIYGWCSSERYICDYFLCEYMIWSYIIYHWGWEQIKCLQVYFYCSHTLFLTMGGLNLLKIHGYEPINTARQRYSGLLSRYAEARSGKIFLSRPDQVVWRSSYFFREGSWTSQAIMMKVNLTYLSV